MMSFFARPSFLGNQHPNLIKGNVIHRLGSEIRGKEMAEYLGAKYNPPEREGVCVFVQPLKLDKVMDGDYVDFGDNSKLHTLLVHRPKIKVITITKYAAEYLKNILPNELIPISQQHLNWENIVNPKRKLAVGGYIGRPSRVSYRITNEIKEALGIIGIDFKTCYTWETRQDAVDFYKSIDFLVIGGNGLERFDAPFTTPTKMINAASFGVPSIAFRNNGYEEFEGYYIPFKTMGELVQEVTKLRDEANYTNFSNKIIEKAKEYHISEVAKKYLQLT